MNGDGGRNRWREIDAVFAASLDLPAGEREAYVRKVGGEDADLVESVLHLLRVHGSAESFLEEPIEAVAPDAWPKALVTIARQLPVDDNDAAVEAVPDRTGERIGPWLLVRMLGRGGMATVYLAERADGQFRQQAALKLLRRGLDTDDFVQRFVAERQILSSLSHPNIAPLLDGGATADGLPYLAVAYVDGVPITEFCDSSGATIEQRLKLFIDVGRAVQYAHANLVVHRDLKPSNILVTAAGRVQLLDFGIAKLLDPSSGPGESPLTRSGFRLLTPEYASPEQVKGESITTASDVYQLGILLYRLLTGHRPYEVNSSSPAALHESITSAVPTRPGTHNRRLRGDLDVIIMKALRKEPERRYGSAIEMVEDIRRHLKGRPISARRESRLYRAGKFLRRNRWGMVTAAVVAALLGVYAGTLLRYGRQLEAERNLARQEAAKAEEVSRFLVDLYRSPDPYAAPGESGGKDITMRRALRDGASRARKELEFQPELQATLLHNIGEILFKLDVPEDALPLWKETLALERSLYGMESDQAASSLWYVAELTAIAVSRDSAERLFRELLKLNTRLHGPNHPQTARALESLGVTLDRMGRVEEAVPYLERAVDIYRSTADSASAEAFAGTLGHLSDAYMDLDRVREALAASQEAVDIAEPVLGPDHPSTAILRVKLAGCQEEAGDLDAAVANYARALPVLQRQLGEEHVQYLNSLNNYAILLQDLGRVDEAETAHGDLLRIRTQKGGESSEEAIASLQNLGALLSREGRYAEADSLVSRAYELYDDLYGHDHYLTAFPLLTLAEIRLERGDFEGAASVATTATQILESTLPAGHYATAVARCRHGRALFGLGRIAESLDLLRPAVRSLKAAESASADRFARECRMALEQVEAATG